MDELDRQIRHIWKKAGKTDSGRTSRECPGDSLLSSYIDGVLKGPDREKVEDHLRECNDCLDLVIVHHKVREGEKHEALEVPGFLMNKAMNLVAGKETGEGFIDIVLKFARETIEIIKNPGNLGISFGALPVPVRGEGTKRSANFITLSKTFSGINSEVEVEKASDNLVNIRVTLKNDGSELPVERLRISLFNPLQEIASFIAKNGEVSFEGLRFGEYVIKINRQGNQVGQISLNIKE